MEKPERQAKNFKMRAEQLRFISRDVRGSEGRKTLTAIARKHEQLAKVPSGKKK